MIFCISNKKFGMGAMNMQRGQTLSEYSLCLAIVLIALIAMNVYVKRGLQARYADVMDSTINAVRAKSPKSVGTQYEPYYAESETKVSVPRGIDQVIGSKASIKKNLSATTTKVDVTSKEGVNPD